MFVKKGIVNFVILYMICFLSHASVSIADDQLSMVLDGILKRYNGLKGLSVPYKREIITKSMAMLGNEVKADAATGKILFKPPDYLAIQQETPARETVTTDGQTLWYYIAQKNAVYEYSADKVSKEIRLFSKIFSGLSKVRDSFEVSQSELADKKEYHLKIVPNPPWEEVDYINLLVNRNNYDIRVVEIHDLLGSTTRFTLDEFSVRKDLQTDIFTFKAPAGAKVIKEGQE
jgi:outer membrane lipoprotein carrier protein